MDDDASDQYELKCYFESLADWLDFLSRNAQLRDSNYIEYLVSHASGNGIRCNALGNVPPERIAVLGQNYREEFLADGFNPRQRTMMELALEFVREIHVNEARIYAHEALTNFALYFRGRFPRFIGSEYAASEDEADALAPIPSVDVERSHFKDASFDIILSGDVFEHVPNLSGVLRDSCRILKPGGRLLASFPFNYGANETVVKAALSAGGITYFSEPEYHGNPADPAAGSLVFQIPGWVILDQARSAGFSEARILFWSSRARGFTAADLAGNLLLCARR